MISFRWETVRLFGDAEPTRLETAIRDVLSQEGGEWHVTVARPARNWRLRLERRETDPANAALLRTTLQAPLTLYAPLPPDAPLRALLADALRTDPAVRTPA